MSEVSERTRWWGWGGESGRATLSERAASLLVEELELAPRDAGSLSARRPALDEVRLPESVLSGSLRARLESAVGERGLRTDALARVARAGGKSYPDLVRLRGGDAAGAPDAVVLPGSASEVAEVLAACSQARSAVVPFGGGTSVVGGVSPERAGSESAVTLDLARMTGVHAVDDRSLTAVVGPGTLGVRAEAALATRGLTLGHFPQSHELATVGGYAATRSAGQASSGYGRFDELVVGLRCSTPAGELVARAVPSSAAGPSLRELVVGSEGTLGVITETTLRLHPAPEARHHEGWSFASFADGAEAFRALARAEAVPDVARLSDEEESRLAQAMASTGSALERAGRAYLRARGHRGGAIAILAFEGDSRQAARRRSRAGRILRGAGGLYVGERPGRAWERSRYAGPYLRDDLIDRGMLVDTLETATSWSGLLTLHHAVGDAVRDALRARGAPAIVGCHVSHLYATGASLYFTVLARAEEGSELEQWRAMKRAAGDAIAAQGATITHHHGVGRDHRPWMAAEVGELGVDILRAVKDRVDPAGVMNPGKLLPGSA